MFFFLLVVEVEVVAELSELVYGLVLGFAGALLGLLNRLTVLPPAMQSSLRLSVLLLLPLGLRKLPLLIAGADVAEADVAEAGVAGAGVAGAGVAGAGVAGAGVAGAGVAGAGGWG